MSLNQQARLIAAAVESSLEESILRATNKIGLSRRLKLVAALLDHNDLSECDYIYTREADAAIAALIERADAGEYDRDARRVTVMGDPAVAGEGYGA